MPTKTRRQIMPTKWAPYVLCVLPLDPMARETRERFVKYREAIAAAEYDLLVGNSVSLLTYTGPGLEPECEDL